MKIEHFGGSAIVRDLDTLRVLGTRHGRDSNEFYISGSERYPLLAILVRGDCACVHFFRTDDHPGFLSVAQHDIGPPDFTTFYTNTPNEEIEVAAEAVVSFELAQQAAEEFFRTNSKPESIQWIEL